MSDLPEYDTVGWGILTGSPWWPMYVCDPQKLRPKLHTLGGAHSSILRKAKCFPDNYRIVYWFGSATFSLMRKGTTRLWNSEEHDKFVKGFPQAPFVGTKKSPGSISMDDLKVAIEEAEDFLAQDESMRLLKHMVPSDMNPSMDPPPPEDDEDDDEDEDRDEEVEKDDEVDNDSDDDDEKPIKPKKKDKKEAKKSKKKSSSSKRKSNPDDDSKPKKRKKSSKKDVDAAARDDDATPIKKKPSASEVAAEEPDKPDDNVLKVRIEDEIRNVLSTGDLEQLTTRKLRQHLADTLKMDLRDHKNTIKEVVNRIIAGMDSVPEAPPPVAVPESVEPIVLLERIHGATGEDVKEPLELLLPIASKLNDTQIAAISARVVEWTRHDDARLAEMAKSLAATWKLEPPAPSLTADKILALKATLEADGSPNDVMLEAIAQLAQAHTAFDVLRKTKIIATVAQLRHHVNDKVSTAAKELRNKWKKDFVETPAPPTTIELGLLSKLETMRRELEKDSSADEALQTAQLASLNELAQMNLSTQDIVASQIGLVVSKLRKAKNTTLAKTAHDLKHKWKEMAKE
ncbi:hypothetical protein H310_06955 [Aphanomyces invadans]|uniref:TFIIS N-terminal domain-containing protein n=1 Tax=Aphanomyces invadans TaxID=157072 RepID=A0A024U5F2_9STRA|nr:hypothetical protein H310_06955 [Aphanomyces invadans]ETW01430.1 hypothetical protein H310_06955 [Aphanomyces invadans]|eukprot:XP_008870428.1 hypothetical protein H310_06955 [Aphanomyces invadans]